MIDLENLEGSELVKGLTEICSQATERIEDAYDMLRADVHLLLEDDDDVSAEVEDAIADELAELIEGDGRAGYSGSPDECDVTSAIEGALAYCRIRDKKLSSALLTDGDD